MISSSTFLFFSTLAVATTTTAQPQGSLHARPAYLGPRDRFWRHNRDQKTLVWKGVELYDTVYNCIFDQSQDAAALSEEERLQLDALAKDPQEPNSPNRSIGKRIVDDKENRFGNIILVEVLHAMEPLQVKAVQRLAHCVRTHIPEYFEVRAMYKEFNLEEDPGLGGNTPTHLMPFLGIYLPSVADTVLQTIRFAYNAAGWQGITIRDKLLGKMSDDPDAPVTREQGVLRASAMPEPEQLGFRASEHLSYDDFPLLDAHHDGTDTAYTVNFAFSGPDDYDGGFLYVIDKVGEKTYFKPNKHSCVVFMGGHYMHGVTKITGGHREMFSNELWFNPDAPIGTTLWNQRPQNMDDFIRECNKVGHVAGEGPCNVTFSSSTQHDISRDEILNGKYATTADEYFEDEMGEEGFSSDSEDEEEEMLYDSEDEPAVAGDEWYWPEEERFAPNDKYFDETEEPNFLVPESLEAGEMAPLYWRDTRERVKDDEAYAIGLPEELLKEFTAYVEKNGMLRAAKKLIYPETNTGEGMVEPFEHGVEHKIYKLEDGQNWGTMRPQW